MEVVKMTITLSLTQLRPKLPDIIDRVSKYFDRCVITRRGKPEAVIIAEDDYESLLETVEILSNKRLMQDVKKAQDDLKKGKGTSWDKLKKKISNV